MSTKTRILAYLYSVHNVTFFSELSHRHFSANILQKLSFSSYLALRRLEKKSGTFTGLRLTL